MTAMLDVEVCCAIDGHRISLEIDSPWAGDSVVGIGQSLGTDISSQQAIELGLWLIEAGTALGKGGAK
ncbi:hypothetical protein AAIB41_13925 [Brucella sp. BE17]|uniref:hypothetical protein n=1 Tax=Brucella sp. BE17 TaxID=3142977 RepID=UPI0031BBBA4D